MHVLADAAVTDPAGFGTALGAAATQALLFFGGGVTAGLTLFAAGLGIRKGIQAIRSVGK